MWIWIVIAVAAILWAVYGAVDRYQRRCFIPEEELWEKLLRADRYVPWTYERRMRYYDRKKRNQPVRMESRKPFVSYIETGYIHREY